MNPTKPSMPRVGSRRSLGPLDGMGDPMTRISNMDRSDSSGLGQRFSPLMIPHGSLPPQMSRRPPVSRGIELARLSEALAGETVMGRFRIEIPLGKGSTGIVFRAFDLPAGVNIALKFLDPELARDPAVVERFRFEALAPTRIGTENVVTVLEADVCPELVPIVRPDDPLSPPIPYLAMELLEGQDLRAYLLDRGPLSPHEVAGFLRQIAPTLDRTHELGIVHRDLKPGNLFLTKSQITGKPLIKILDFGIAQLSDASAARGLGGGLFGTPWYMSPEQAQGGIASAASDRWAIALIAFRLLTAESYWAPCKIAELLGQIVEGPMLPPSEVVRQRALSPLVTFDADFDAWFMKACSVNPKDRYGSTVEQVTALADALGCLTPSYMPPPPDE